MKDKSGTSKIFQTFTAMIQTQFSTNIFIFCTDRARDFFNSVLGDYLATREIVHQSNCVDTPQQNGVAERTNRHLFEMARSLLFTRNVPRHWWGETVLTATYLINRMPSRVLRFQTPIESFLQVYPNSHLLHIIPLRVFGCSSFVHIHSQFRGKLDLRSLKCIFLGYSPNQKGYVYYSPTTRKFYCMGMSVSMRLRLSSHLPWFRGDCSDWTSQCETFQHPNWLPDTSYTWSNTHNPTR